MKKLLGSYLSEELLLKVEKDFLQKIAMDIAPFRPSFRAHIPIDYAQNFALLCVDQAKLPSRSLANHQSPSSLSFEFKVRKILFERPPKQIEN